jgi:uncharacterized repeat protein (TIGR03803 family)
MTKLGQQQDWISRSLGAAYATLMPALLVLLFGIVAARSVQAQTFTLLHNFNGPDGASPSAGLVRDAAGNLYGTTENGGSGCGSGQGCGGGVVFKVNKAGKVTVLYNFCSASGCTDGAQPTGGLIQDAKGNLYGTTSGGGSSGYGTVFELSKNGTEKVLYSFAGGPSDGQWPEAELLMDAAGNLYSTTSAGGATRCEGYGCGTVFKLDTTGKETVLYSFTGGTDGGYPSGGLVRDKLGNLYGVIWQGGDYCFTNQDCGVLYKLSMSGTLTVLQRFTYEGKTNEGCWPYGTPVMDKSGNLFGTTEISGSYTAGVVWKVTQKGVETVLHNFSGSDGATPSAGVIMDCQWQPLW